MDLSTASGYRPAQGLRKLTWPQVEMIDQVIASMCEFSKQNSDHLDVTIEVHNGHPRLIRRPFVTSELRPGR